jgi:uncharacterized protein YdeI (YjbR/CyaY-like superfamily)
MVLELPELVVSDAAAWRSWLEENHGASSGIRLVLHKKGGKVTALTHDDALDEALCFGWIDGQVGSRDEGSFHQRFTPRRRRSIWSLRNVSHVERLESEGRMHDAGRAAVRAAKQDGRWATAYPGQASADMPPDLADAIARVPAAQAMFDVLTSQNRYALVFRLSQLKEGTARRKKIAGFVEMLARHDSSHPQRRKP